MSIEHVTPAGANIFEDLGLEESENLRLRAQLMMEVRRFIEENHLGQQEAAQLMGTTQPRISDVTRGRVDKCTIDRLVKMLAKVGRHVKLTVEDEAA